MNGVGARKGAISQTIQIIIDNESTLQHKCMTSYGIIHLGLNPFLPHARMHEVGLSNQFCPSVCLSVCLSSEKN